MILFLRCLLLIMAGGGWLYCQENVINIPPLQAVGGILDDEAAQSVAAPCSTKIPLEWSASWPVPLGDPDGRFNIFFYPVLMRSAARADAQARGLARGMALQAYAPLGAAVLSAEKVYSCRRLPGRLQVLDGMLASKALDGLSLDQIEQRADRLYAASESDMAEPVLIPFYRRLNPDFWDWLKEYESSPI